MKITVDINENEILNAADEMIAAAEELGRKAWRLKHLIEGKEVPMSEKRKNWLENNSEPEENYLPLSKSHTAE